MQFLRTLVILLLILAVVGPFAHPNSASANIIDDLKAKMEKTAEEKKKLEEEIAVYQQQLNVIGQQKSTLNSAVQTLDTTRKKLATDITLTEKSIDSAELNVKRLSFSIVDTEKDVATKSVAIKHFIRALDATENLSIIEIMLSRDSLSDFWGDIESMSRFEESMATAVNDLLVHKIALEGDMEAKEKEQKNLEAYQSRLSDQKTIVDQNRAEKNALLQKTKNQESSYKSILAEKERLKAAFEKDILNYESQIKIALDPNAFPTSGSGVLAWPLDTVHITQYFGTTAFSLSGAYNGSGHNGLDMGTPVGTPVKAVLSGTVQGTGNTDAYPGCYSYGKWVLIKHYNGLSTLYAHFSLIKVSAGQTVTTGDIIGYSGNTGYSTGPHLHFGVYASQGVQIVKMGDIKKVTNCGGASVPVASLNAYMNPLDYMIDASKYR